MGTFRHEKYEVWQKGVEFSVQICQCIEGFPSLEKYALADQLRRAAISVPSNIAEGSGRGSDLEFARFLGIAYGSLMEVLTQIEIAQRLKYLSAQESEKFRKQAVEISKMLSGLRRTLKRTKAKSGELKAER